MNGPQFVRRARRYARRTRQEFWFDHSGGKGSHGRVHLGGRLTTVPHHEIHPGLLHSMLRDLNINRRDF